MSWLFSAALLPFVLCGAICLGGALLAALGLRRGRRDREAPNHQTGAVPPSATLDQ